MRTIDRWIDHPSGAEIRVVEGDSHRPYHITVGGLTPSREDIASCLDACLGRLAELSEVREGKVLVDRDPVLPIANRLRTQDNRVTAHPIFIVQQRRRIWGLADGYEEGTAWIDDEGAEVEPGLITAGLRRVGYRDVWEFVTACFTEEGANEYVRVNGHNLKSPRVYAASAWRNAEWITLRETLLAVAEVAP